MDLYEDGRGYINISSRTEVAFCRQLLLISLQFFNTEGRGGGLLFVSSSSCLIQGTFISYQLSMEEPEDWRQSRLPCGQKQKTLECFFFSSSPTRLLSWPTSFKQQNSLRRSMDSLGSGWNCGIIEEEKYRNTNVTKEQKQEQLKRHYLCFSVSVWAPRSMDWELLWVYEKGNLSWSDDSRLLQYLKPCHPICTELTLFWSNLEQITVAPNGSAGCLLQGGDKSLYAGSSGPARFHPTIAWLPADVWHAKHRLEIRWPATAHLHVLHLMIQAREGPPHTHNTHTHTLYHGGWEHTTSVV